MKDRVKSASARQEYLPQNIKRFDIFTNENVDREKVSQDIQRSFKEKSNLRVDEVAFVSPGTIPEGYKHIVDERSYQ